jgi:uncharacterized membrane protein YsdA (DUF1294 family)
MEHRAHTRGVGKLLEVIAYLGAVNILTYLTFAWDKHCARHGSWRVAESRLLALAAIGGTIGAVAGQRILRHKTQKEPFRTYLRFIGVTQTALSIAALYYLG